MGSSSVAQLQGPRFDLLSPCNCLCEVSVQLSHKCPKPAFKIRYLNAKYENITIKLTKERLCILKRS